MAKKEKMKKEKPARSKHPFRNAFWAIKLIWKLSPFYVIGSFLASLIGYGQWVFFTLVFTQYIFGSSEMLHSFRDVVIFMVIALAVDMLDIGFNSLFYRWKYTKKLHIVEEELQKMVFTQAANLDLACFESTEYYDKYTKAAETASTKIFDTLAATVDFFSAILASIYVIVTMFSINVWIGLISMLPVVAGYTFGKLGAKVGMEQWKALVPFNRKLEFIKRAFLLQKYSKEMRLTDAPDMLVNKIDSTNNEFLRVTYRYAPKLFIFGVINFAMCFPLMFEGIWLLGAYLVMVKHALTIAEYVVVATAATSTTHMVNGCKDSLVMIFENALYIDNLKEFLEYRPKIPENQDGLPVPEKVETLELCSVSFRYKENLPEALHGIDLKLKAGEMITVVGYNGSGKSTLVKLIMRLYDPTDGVIKLNGVDIREYNVKAYRSLIGATFQDFGLFSMSVTDNVCFENNIGDYREKSTISALEKSGVYGRISELPNGIDTILTKEFDEKGAVLSGGEGQKVAIARAFAKKNSILILDEPSSALDPIAENHVFSNFVELSKGDKISIFISHRLSSATIADRVIVLSNGSIAEEGTHTELMEMNGIYADMFSKQAENYRDTEGVSA